MCLGVLGLTALPCFRSRKFALSSRLHTLVSAGLVLCLWKRLGQVWTISHLFLLGASSLYVLSTVRRVLITIWQSFGLLRGWSRATVEHIGEAQVVTVDLPRQFRFNAGQYIYLWIPRLLLRSAVLSYPLTIAWWTEHVSGSVDTLILLIKSRGGLSRRLALVTSLKSLLVAIEGPYGPCIDTSIYGTLILYASGIGIAAHTAIMKQAINDCNLNQNCL